MPDLRRPVLDPAGGRWLTPDEYDDDYEHRHSRLHGQDSWKLERLQNFHEDDDPSYDALRRGEWQEALRLLDEELPDLRAWAADERRHDSVFHRVRIVEEPLTPYMQWELHALRNQSRVGLPVRVVQAGAVSHFEPPEQGALPELLVVGGLAMYRVSYRADGVHDGAVQYTDPVVVRPWQEFIEALYATGEDVVTYVERYVAHLPAPTVRTP
jgi:hypothetical protein